MFSFANNTNNGVFDPNILKHLLLQLCQDCFSNVFLDIYREERETTSAGRDLIFSTSLVFLAAGKQKQKQVKITEKECVLRKK